MSKFDYLEERYDSPDVIVDELTAMIKTLADLRSNTVNVLLAAGKLAGDDCNSKELQELQSEIHLYSRQIYNSLYEMKELMSENQVFTVCVNKVFHVTLNVEAKDKDDAERKAMDYVYDNFTASINGSDEHIEDWNAFVEWSDLCSEEKPDI